MDSWLLIPPSRLHAILPTALSVHPPSVNIDRHAALSNNHLKIEFEFMFEFLV